MDLLTHIHQLIADRDSILISGQDNPDGDSVGAQLALYDMITQEHAWLNAGRALEIVIANDAMPPAIYQCLPNIARIIPAEQIAARQFDVGFILDTSTDRTGQTRPVLERCRATINIDHHRTRSAAADTVAWIEPATSSVCEMLYAVIEHPAWHVALTPDMAACLYAGMAYDTGVFRYPSTTARTLRIAAALVERGIDFGRIIEQMLLEKSRAALNLLAAVLNDVFWDKTGDIVVGAISQAMWLNTGAQPGDEDGLITHYAFTTEAKAVVLLRELPSGEVKVSFRSRGAVDVSVVARRLHPQGGGHARAAGCTLTGTLPDVRAQVVAALQQALRA
jgi:bifunctional oligoribonuclease and PAP phosphatase NrnA